MFTLYNVISFDGYITGKDGDESFIPDSLWPTVLEVFKRYKIFLMGSATYKAFQNYGQVLLEPFEKLNLRKIVVSRDKTFQVKVGYEVIGTPEKVASLGKDIIVSSGSILNNYLFQNNLVDTIILHRLDESIGDGVKPFDEKFFEDFTLISELRVGDVKEFIYKKSSGL